MVGVLRKVDTYISKFTASHSRRLIFIQLPLAPIFPGYIPTSVYSSSIGGSSSSSSSSSSREE